MNQNNQMKEKKQMNKTNTTTQYERQNSRWTKNKTAKKTILKRTDAREQHMNEKKQIHDKENI